MLQIICDAVIVYAEVTEMDFANLRINDIVCTIRYTPTKDRFISRNKPCHILGIQLSGNADHDFGFQRLTLDENCLYFLNQAEDYDVQVNERGLAFSVHFTTFEPIDTHSFALHLKANGEVVSLLEKIDREYHGKHRDAVMLSDLYRLCALYDAVYQKKYRPSDPRQSKAAEYLDSHFREKDCLAKAAAVCGVSERRFNDLFKQWFHTTPNRYITDKKLALAKQLLLYSEALSVTDVAQQCGFSDVYYFSKVFKQATGSSPTEFTNSQKKR